MKQLLTLVWLGAAALSASAQHLPNGDFARWKDACGNSYHTTALLRHLADGTIDNFSIVSAGFLTEFSALCTILRYGYLPFGETGEFYFIILVIHNYYLLEIFLLYCFHVF